MLYNNKITSTYVRFPKYKTNKVISEISKSIVRKK
ncbi:MAG: hypothetical protein ACI9XB_002381, partial [Gammaproteobacteria bacterium]